MGQLISAAESLRAGGAITHALILAARVTGGLHVEPPPGGAIWTACGAVEFQNDRFSILVEGAGIEIDGCAVSALKWLKNKRKI